ncbi:KAP family P-loop NTPase fold protein [Megalodesulfovibrio paquesii]
MSYRVKELEVTCEKPFANDALKREPHVTFLADLIQKLDGPFVMALDSPWGTGKTTFVQMLKANLQNQGVQCTYFNAWKVDYVTDPLVALVAQIDKVALGDQELESGVQAHLGKLKGIVTNLAKNGAVAIVKAATYGMLDCSKEVETIAANFCGTAADNIIDEFTKKQNLLDEFRKALSETVANLSEKKSNTNLVFFIDELDRCRPTFAIELLERVKHLFDVPNLIFVVSIDKKQLVASTKAVYGADIEAAEYLRRFFDLEYSLPAVSLEAFITQTVNNLDIFPDHENSTMARRHRRESYINYLTYIVESFELSLRSTERCLTRLKVLTDPQQQENSLEPVLIILLIVLHLSNQELFKRVLHNTIGPEEILATLPPAISATKSGTSEEKDQLYAALVAADPDFERFKKNIEHFQIISKNESLHPTLRNHAIQLHHELLSLSFAHRSNGPAFYTKLAEMVSLAANINPG